MKDELIQATVDAGGTATMVKIAPPVAAAGYILMGLPLSQWALILTIVYTILMIGAFIYDRFIKKKRRKDDDDWEDYITHRLDDAEHHLHMHDEKLK